MLCFRLILPFKRPFMNFTGETAGNNTGSISGGIVGAILFVIIVVAIVILVQRRVLGRQHEISLRVSMNEN